VSLTVRLKKLPKPVFAAVLIAVGVAGRLLLAGAPNVEPVLVISMLAGCLLGGLYAVVVPVAVMGISDPIVDAVYGSSSSPLSLLGLAGFVYTGYVFVSIVGGFAMRRRIVWRTKTIAVFTAISIPLTIAFDVWTAFGDWLFIGREGGLTLLDVYGRQASFTLIHIFSSLLFAPILGATFLAMHLHGVPVPMETAPEPSEE